MALPKNQIPSRVPLCGPTFVCACGRRRNERSPALSVFRPRGQGRVLLGFSLEPYCNLRPNWLNRQSTDASTRQILDAEALRFLTLKTQHVHAARANFFHYGLHLRASIRNVKLVNNNTLCSQDPIQIVAFNMFSAKMFWRSHLILNMSNMPIRSPLHTQPTA